MRQIEATRPAAAAPPTGDPFERWEVAAIGPGWTPVMGESELPPVDGYLSLHPDALVFRASDTVDRASGETVIAEIPAESVIDSGPLSPGSRATASEPMGLWMPRFMRRFRAPGFWIRTSDGSWAFDCRRGVDRAGEVRRRYVSG